MLPGTWNIVIGAMGEGWVLSQYPVATEARVVGDGSIEASLTWGELRLLTEEAHGGLLIALAENVDHALADDVRR